MRVDMSKPTTERLNSRLSYDDNCGISSSARAAMRAIDRELRREQEYNKNNVCPICHLVLPMSHSAECDCGYMRPVIKRVI